MSSAVQQARDRIASRVAPAISGANGRAQLWQACLVAILFDLAEDQFLSACDSWNSSCSPPWSEKELRQAYRDASRNAKVPRGKLLESRRASFRPARPRRSPAPATAPTAPPPEAAVNEDAIKAAYREQWPALKRPTEYEIQTIARLRHVSAGAVWDLVYSGCLKVGRHMSRNCFFLTDGNTFRQARRLNGQPFDTAHGPAKNINPRGSQGKWFSPGGLGSAAHVVITEGVIGSLEVAEMIRRAEFSGGGARSVAILAATTAGTRLSPEILSQLSGRAITILGDSGPAGLNAITRWSSQICEATGIIPRCFRPPDPHADFGRLLPIFPINHSLWTLLIPPTKTAAA